MFSSNNIVHTTTAGSVLGTGVTLSNLHVALYDPSTLAVYTTIFSGSLTGILALIGIIAWGIKTFFSK